MHQGALWVFVISDNINDTVQIQERDDKAFEHLKAVINLVDPVL